MSAEYNQTIAAAVEASTDGQTGYAVLHGEIEDARLLIRQAAEKRDFAARIAGTAVGPQEIIVSALDRLETSVQAAGAEMHSMREDAGAATDRIILANDALGDIQITHGRLDAVCDTMAGTAQLTHGKLDIAVNHYVTSFGSETPVDLALGDIRGIEAVQRDIVAVRSTVDSAKSVLAETTAVVDTEIAYDNEVSAELGRLAAQASALAAGIESLRRRAARHLNNRTPLQGAIMATQAEHDQLAGQLGRLDPILDQKSAAIDHTIEVARSREL